MNKLSATVITLNEEEKLPECLESIKDLVDEIIVVDSGSEDKTVEIAKDFGAKTFVRKFDNFANQKNYASERALGEWILSIDADEIIPPELAKEILEAINSNEYEGYLMPRRNFILGAEIKHSRWSPDKHIWLWKKKFGKWEGNVHEEVVVRGRVGELKEGKFHYQDRTIGDFIAKNKKYARLLAEKMFLDGQRFSLVKFIWDPTFEFMVRFVYKKGFLDGWRGLVLATLMAFYKTDVWLQILRLSFQGKKK